MKEKIKTKKREKRVYDEKKRRRKIEEYQNHCRHSHFTRYESLKKLSFVDGKRRKTKKKTKSNCCVRIKIFYLIQLNIFN